MPEELPPLNALRAFDAAARYESFVLAGKELFVSPGAISRHVRTLEGYLNTTLFTRRSNGVSLTNIGQAYLERIRPILSELAMTSREFSVGKDERTLVISTLPVFSEKWLAPRLMSFQEKHPKIRFRLDFHSGVDIVPSPGVDALIVYSEEPPGCGTATRLFGETLVPVCSPAFRRQLPETLTPADILRQTLLQDSYWQDDWSIWADALEQNSTLVAQNLSFALYSAAIQSTISGMGMAIGHSAMIQHELASGTLIALGEFAIPSPKFYFQLLPQNCHTNPKLLAFIDWLALEAREVADSPWPG